MFVTGFSRQFGQLVGVLVLLSLGFACLQKEAPQREPVEVAEPQPPEPVTPPEDIVEEPNCDEFELRLEATQRELAEQQKANTDLRMQLFEKEAHIQGLERRLRASEELIDDTILEVVRAKAKVQSLDTKVDAASMMAETEFAVNTLNAETSTLEDGPVRRAVRQAALLLSRSNEEFDKENYSGSLFLSSHAAQRVKRARRDLSHAAAEPSVEGEVLFRSELDLVLTENSRIRQGPGLNFKTLTILDKGTSVTALSYAGEWIRITTENGTTGWVFKDLVVRPE